MKTTVCDADICCDRYQFGLLLTAYGDPSTRGGRPAPRSVKKLPEMRGRVAPAHFVVQQCSARTDPVRLVGDPRTPRLGH
jgi:hypothetical protein